MPIAADFFHSALTVACIEEHPIDRESGTDKAVVIRECNDIKPLVSPVDTVLRYMSLCKAVPAFVVQLHAH